MVEIYGVIYIIWNVINTKVYIGQTVNLRKREKSHLHLLRKNKHYNSHLQNSFNKYGEENFTFKIIRECNSKDELDEMEMYYIEKYDSYDRYYGYNVKEGGYYTNHSEESILKMKENNPKHWLGKKFSEKTKQKMSNAQKGKIMPYESIVKLRKLKRNKGIFGFSGCFYKHKQRKPFFRVWNSGIYYNKHRTSLGYFNDPLSCEIVHDLVEEEIMKVKKNEC